MCGIAGIWSLDGREGETALRRAGGAMASALAHRGPDGSGLWVDAPAGLALAHRRLAILDLSSAGAQPMASADGRWVVSYNGEIYNFAELRAELAAAGCRFRTGTDTEVLVEAAALWGLEATLARLNGMFAFALWDRRERRLFLARDALGIKPLYWSLEDGLVLFGSELKALAAHPRFRRRVDPAAVAAFLDLGHVPGTQSIWQGVAKLAPGGLVGISADGRAERRSWWRLETVIGAAAAESWTGTAEAATDRLEALLLDAVRRQMVADVPVGVLLSGGIDSSTVAALAQAAAPGTVRSFSVGFRAAGYDESAYAAGVARHLGTCHTELTVDAAEALAVVPRLAEMYDEPFADSSQIPTHLVSALTRQHVAVVLSGDGGDELFAGYNRHVQARRLHRLAALPRPLRRAAAGLLGAVPVGAWGRVGAALGRPRLGERLHKAATLMGAVDAEDLYRRLLSPWGGSAPALRDDGRPAAGPAAGPAPCRDDPVAQLQFLDTRGYLPDDILTKVDRASMAVGLEARVPLLDTRVLAFAWSLPQELRVRGGTGKWLLRRVLHRHVPPALVDRPKMGFAAPVGAWLRGPLRDWAEALLTPAALDEAGFADPTALRRRWDAHQAGRRDWQHGLWCVLMLQAWRQRWLTAPLQPPP